MLFWFICFLYIKGMKLEKPFFFRVTSEEENTPIKVQDVQIFKTTSERKIVTIEKVQKFKDQYLISERCIQAFKTHVFQDMPSILELRDHRKKQKKKIPITSNSKGVFNDLEAKISSILTLHLSFNYLYLSLYLVLFWRFFCPSMVSLFRVQGLCG